MGVIKYQVTEEDKKRFDEDGYWISPKLIDDETIQRLREAHERIWNKKHDGHGLPFYHYSLPENPLAIRKLDNGWWINDEVRSVVTNRNLGHMAAELLNEDSIRLWHDQVIYKPGTNGQETKAGNVGWHQDYGYWRNSSTSNMVTVWIALQDTDLTNGGMMTILGSHKWGAVEGSDTFFEQDMSKLKEKFAKRDWVEEPCILKAGQASFHHALTFHGSGPNLTNDARLSIVAHLMPGDTYYRGGKQRHDNLRLLGARPEPGMRFDREEYFPTLYSR
ncbi:phytanoyl-CoA dioxygenase family protein [Paenibacillus sacheonensis]|uniref:Phytanoyl-CoA dioxygenase family protein n=1 Tax=Paenibacillus sacheonensis TaxID=742054 RepID=A0A7X4YJM6_9BACL|nr:phytanoyl-CoA dioxygenase family protein [Paenibacillus sacheonensis]MBM7564175.1 ectoine hydroxylase-related dioxygenase (phytanoyl-CoA dioxygenase family) [Paenibacillus sacheonensis]NBC67497.1 phytanoyl-CoA dioxygenase family protein [Paenibacillus sacheonensis]